MNVSGFNILRNSAISDEKKSCKSNISNRVTQHNKKNRSKKGPRSLKKKIQQSLSLKNLPRSDLMWIDKTKRVISLENREFDNAEKFLKNLLTKGLNRSGIPKGLRTDVEKGFTITTGDKKLRKSIKGELLEFISIDEKSLFFLQKSCLLNHIVISWDFQDLLENNYSLEPKN